MQWRRLTLPLGGGEPLADGAAVLLALLVHASLAATPPEEVRYQAPPPDVSAILDARRPPSVRLSPDQAWIVLLDRPALAPVADLAAPVVKVAGVRIDPRSNGPARENPYTALSLRLRDKPKAVPVPVAVEGRIRSVSFDAASRHLLITTLEAQGIGLWLADVSATPKPRRLLGPTLNAAYGSPCAWLAADQGVVCQVIPKGRGPAPVQASVPTGPRVEENLGRKTPGRTYADLLQTEHDEALLDHYLTSEVVHIALDGKVVPLLDAALWASVAPSPDGKWLLTDVVNRPYSRQVPLRSFPRTTVVRELGSGKAFEVAALPLADDVPVPFGSVRTGRRTVSWRADQPATLWWVMALDGGDAGKAAEVRDALETWTAPFTASPVRLTTLPLRFTDVTWGDATTALVSEWWYADRRTRTWRFDPSKPTSDKVVVWDRSYQDRYSDPGDPLLEPGPYGAGVLRRTPTGGLLLSGEGIATDGVHPFLDRFEWGKSTRLWQAKDPLHESVVDVLDDAGKFLLTWRESQTEVPNLWLRKNGRPVQRLTDFVDWAPTFADVKKEVVTYTRADGLPLSATVYTPPGWTPEKGPTKAVFWVYPNEFKRRDDAGQVTASENTFARPGGSSHLFFLMQGYVVVDDPVLPIVAEGEAQPNDTYVEQLVAGAQAAVDALAARGFIDKDQLLVGGHSYGAFTTANLLAHTELFKAGIARSGAYNRTLTPFGFQGEERTFWEAEGTYMGMSPFSVADQVNEPLLLLHGGDDSNSGTWPLQSERYYEALKGHGATVRWVELPAEDHGYRGRESVGHALWEMFRWAETYVAPTGDVGARTPSGDQPN